MALYKTCVQEFYNSINVLLKLLPEPCARKRSLGPITWSGLTDGAVFSEFFLFASMVFKIEFVRLANSL